MKDAAKWFRQSGPDIAEIYSPPRIVQEAGLRRYAGVRLRPGWSLDLTTNDPETGEPWDLSRKDKQDKVRRMIKDGKPFVLVGSPPCTAFSRLQALSSEKRNPEVVKEELRKACPPPPPKPSRAPSPSSATTR